MDRKDNNKKLIELIQQGIDTKENLERLYFQNKGFMYMVIKKRVHGIFEESDLMQQSFIALVKAVEYYDWTLEETNFLQILKYCIWNEIRNLTSDIPAHMQAKIIKYRIAYNELYNDLGYKPKSYQVMNKLNISLKELEKIRVAMKIPLSFDEPINDEGDTTRMDLYSNSRAIEEDFYDNLEKQDLKKILREAIETLPEASQDIIDKRYYRNQTLEEIGKEMNITRERVRQMETKALWTLRRDYKFKEKIIDYTGLNEYKQVGSRQFNATKTSSVEWLVLEREKIDLREQEISLWLNNK